MYITQLKKTQEKILTTLFYKILMLTHVFFVSKVLVLIYVLFLLISILVHRLCN